MSALLRQGAKRIGGSVLQRTKSSITPPAVAEERRRLLPSRMNSTEERIAEGKNSLKDLPDQVGPKPDGFNSYKTKHMQIYESFHNFFFLSCLQELI